MKIGLFGKTGQVAQEIQRRVPANVVLTVLGRDAADFSSPMNVRRAMDALEVDVAVNAVAYTAVDQAETEQNLANAVNGLSVKALGEVCASRGIPLVHLSTDYVFPGHGETPWKPDDATDPQNVYGASKLAGEQALTATGARHITLRTSWVFSAHGKNFVKTMLRLGADRDTLEVVADQFGGPTPAADIADTCLALADALVQGHRGGTYHYTGGPDVCWADFAREVFFQSGLKVAVTNVTSDKFPTPAARPLNSRLDCRSLETEFGISRPDWLVGLQDVLEDLNSRVQRFKGSSRS
ncbi:MAG: dTDP-4-dehydrorhamnose reductase [Paracoccaceae bacterium]|nr:dTDP-4-dehydrorhamnose reductase [Paracoccaceae bacterium]